MWDLEVGDYICFLLKCLFVISSFHLPHLSALPCCRVLSGKQSINSAKKNFCCCNCLALSKEPVLAKSLYCKYSDKKLW